MTVVTADALVKNGYKVLNDGAFFDTIVVDVSSKGKTSAEIQANAVKNGVNVRIIDDKKVGISFGESITREDTANLLNAFGLDGTSIVNNKSVRSRNLPEGLERNTAFLTHPVFNSHHSETQMLRYMKVRCDLFLVVCLLVFCPFFDLI
jgi:glycine dehydrogenase